ncbi:MAG: archease [Gemmatimonadota bacterium]
MDDRTRSNPTASDQRSSGHEFLDHTSEIVVRLHAPSFPELLAEASRAFAALVPADAERRDAPDVRELTLEGADPAAMLVDWMNELVFLAESECWIPTEISAREERDAGTSPSSELSVVRVRARGQILQQPFVFVKAATLHGVDVRGSPERIEAEVTLDV